MKTTSKVFVVVAAMLLAGAMRLARFNLSSDVPHGGWFTGIPITAAGGGLISSMVIVMTKYDDISSVLPLHLYLPILMFMMGILMVSRIRFPKATMRESNIINAFQIINIALIFYCGIFRVYPEYLFGIGVFLLIAGSIAGRITRDNPR